jgi:hypothetical protein
MTWLRRAALGSVVLAAMAATGLSARQWLAGGDAPPPVVTRNRDALTQHEDDRSGRAPGAAGVAAAGAPGVVARKDAAFLARLDHEQPRPVGSTAGPRIRLASAFQRMQAMAPYFNRDALRREEMRELVEDPDAVAIAVRAAVDPAYAREAFGEQQAEARVYSIKLLAEAARRGVPEPLNGAVRTLAASLASALQANRPIGKAQDRDLADLLDTAVASLVEGPRGTLEQDLRSGLRGLGYSPSMPAAVRKVFDDAVFQPLLARVGRAEASRLVAAALTDEEAH